MIGSWGLPIEDSVWRYMGEETPDDEWRWSLSPGQLVRVDYVWIFLHGDRAGSLAVDFCTFSVAGCTAEVYEAMPLVRFLSECVPVGISDWEAA